MAVPKKKRYKQVVGMRRTLFNITSLTKKNVKILKFMNFLYVKNRVMYNSNKNFWINTFLYSDRLTSK